MSDATIAAAPAASEQVAAESAPANGAAEDAVIGKWAEATEEALLVAPDKLIAYLTDLRDRQGYDLLSGVTCVDYSAYGGKLRSGVGERFEVVYHLYSTKKGGGPLVLHVRVPQDETLPSATGVYPGANLQESEVYDLYGIKFDGPS